jgi:hypothetical protein
MIRRNGVSDRMCVATASSLSVLIEKTSLLSTSDSSSR